MGIKLFADGGSRGNPGPAACAFVIESTPPHQGFLFLGATTNNVAEYQGLILGLKTAVRENILEIDICLDSELIVKQLKGEYKVKHENMKPLHQETKTLLAQLKTWTICHIPREENTKADELVNFCLDNYQKAGNP